MILYFEINFHETGPYTIDNIRIVPDTNIKSPLGFDIGYTEENTSWDSYSVLMDLDRDDYDASGPVMPILEKIKFNFLRNEKIRKILNK